MSDSQSDDEGVIGYHATTVTPAIMQPMAAAAFPSMRIFPAVSFIGSMTERILLGEVALRRSPIRP